LTALDRLPGAVRPHRVPVQVIGGHPFRTEAAAVHGRSARTAVRPETGAAAEAFVAVEQVGTNVTIIGAAQSADNPRRVADQAAEPLSRALGWLSLALGATALAAPRAVSKLAGVDDSRRAQLVLRAAGVRELMHAAGLLGSRNPGPWVWTRVLGDAMDLSALGRAMVDRHGERRRRAAMATAAVVGITAVDVLAAILSTRSSQARKRAMCVSAAVTVNRSPEEVYRFWRNFENLPGFMYHLESVRTDGDGRSHWTARGPAGRTVEWDAEIIEEVPNHVIAWRSRDGSKVPNSGRVRFDRAAGGRGTEIRVEMDYAPPGGPLGKAVAAMFGEEPNQQVKDDLRRFKQVIETGEVVRSEGTPHGTSVREQVKQRPAQPVPSAPR
jgi:uncharacterized membrane protein